MIAVVFYTGYTGSGALFVNMGSVCREKGRKWNKDFRYVNLLITFLRLKFRKTVMHVFVSKTALHVIFLQVTS